MAIVLSTLGERTYVDLTKVAMAERVATIRRIVGGYVEAIPLGGGEYLLFWEDAKAKGLPTNLPATLLAKCFLMDDDYIAGVVVQATRSELDAAP